MSHKTTCDFCADTITGHFYFKHIISQHFNELFNPTTSYGKNNLTTLKIDKVRSTPYTLYLPNNNQLYICMNCNKAVKKFPFIKSCVDNSPCPKANLEILREWRKKLDITDISDNIPPLVSNNIVTNLTPDRELAYQKLIGKLLVELKNHQEFSWLYDECMKDREVSELVNDLNLVFPEHEAYDIEIECKELCKYLKINYDTIRESVKKRLPLQNPQ